MRNGSTDLPRLLGWLRPLVNRVAAIRRSVHSKLLVGFLFSAGLLVAMAALSLVVQAHMAGRVDEINRADKRVDLLRQMLYLVTAQSHYRTMALLTHDSSYNNEIAQAKTDFLSQLESIQPITPASQQGILARITETNDQFNTSSAQVLTLYQSGDSAGALQLHLSQEHPISHEIEDPIQVMINQAEQQAGASQSAFESDKRLMTGLLVGFSVIALLSALLLGFVLSWSFVLPLRGIGSALGRIAGGRFEEHVDVYNRDEFGLLAHDLNTTSQELANMYSQLESLNQQLRGTNTELLAQLQAQVEELARSRELITEAEERLRRDIAEVLHSRVQNRLLIIWYRLEDAQELLQTDSASASQLLGEIREQVDDIREQDVRELSHRLHPSIIRAGLLPALEALADEPPRVEVQIHADAAVRALDESSGEGFPEVMRLTAYRVVEEALGNVVRHAEASHVDVNLRVDAAALRIDVLDNGRGFEPRTLRPGLGLGSIAAHVGRSAGRWSISSVPGQGTVVTVVLPLSVEQVQDGLGTQPALRQESGPQSDSGLSVAGTL
jgi:signal transduction histidine kinase